MSDRHTFTCRDLCRAKPVQAIYFTLFSHWLKSESSSEGPEKTSLCILKLKCTRTPRTSPPPSGSGIAAIRSRTPHLSANVSRLVTFICVTHCITHFNQDWLMRKWYSQHLFHYVRAVWRTNCGSFLRRTANWWRWQDRGYSLIAQRQDSTHYLTQGRCGLHAVQRFPTLKQSLTLKSNNKNA